ncbi:hypothetical protein GH733_010394 [Mirounga leonina]|nr:hypothetical protein GH733_010394 [Mirounga leonina]
MPGRGGVRCQATSPDGLGEACVEVGRREEGPVELPGRGPAVLLGLSMGLACSWPVARRGGGSGPAASAPCPGAGQELVGGGGGARLRRPHPSASLASQAVLRGEQASCLLPLRQQVWDDLGASLAETETKASLNKDPSKPTPSPGAVLSSCTGMRALSCRNGVSGRFLRGDPSTQEASNSGGSSGAGCVGGTPPCAGPVSTWCLRRGAGCQLGEDWMELFLRGPWAGAWRPASGASAPVPLPGPARPVCRGEQAPGFPGASQHLLKAFALGSARHWALRGTGAQGEGPSEVTRADPSGSLACGGLGVALPVVASLMSVGLGQAGGAGCVQEAE